MRECLTALGREEKEGSSNGLPSQTHSLIKPPSIFFSAICKFHLPLIENGLLVLSVLASKSIYKQATSDPTVIVK